MFSSFYEAASGQKINLEKSEVSFSRNVSPESQNILQMKLNFTAVNEQRKYLGLPMSIGRSKKVVFQTIQDRVWKKIKGWKERYLSRAGREVLVKAVVQAIPMYVMQCFKIPEGVINNMVSLCRNFWWGQQGNERKLPLISWEKMCHSKEAGGLGLRDLGAFNTALLAKQYWRIVTNPESFVATILKGKYFPRTEFWEAKVPQNASYTWHSIISARELLKEGSRWVVGNGRKVKFWKDPWLKALPRGRVWSTPPDEAILRPYVADWQVENGDEWDFAALDGVLTTEEMEAVKGVTVASSDQ